MKCFTLLTAALIGSTPGLYAGTSGFAHTDSDLPVDPVVAFGQLPNGLRYAVMANGEPQERAALRLLVEAGSLHETEEQRGLAHFLEHMIFRGTEQHPNAYDLNMAVEKLGGNLFAATGPDSTEFGITLPTECLVSGAQLLAEVVTKPIFRDMEIERRIITEEIREDLDEEGKPIDVDFLSRRRLWPEHPLGHAVTGPLENAMAFTGEDIRAHFIKHYVAENAVVCLSGAYRISGASSRGRTCGDDAGQ